MVAARTSWTATSNAGFIVIREVTTSQVSYTVERNTGPERVGTISVAGQTVEVRPAAGPSVVTPPSQAPQPPTTVAGTVTTARGDRILFVLVEVVSGGLPTGQQTMTDNLGGYRLNGIQVSPFNLRFSHATYQTQILEYPSPGTSRTDLAIIMTPLVSVPANSLAILDVSHVDAELPYAATVSADGTPIPETWVKAVWGDFVATYNGSFWPHYQVAACFKKSGNILRHTCDVRTLQCAFNSDLKTCTVLSNAPQLRPSVQQWVGGVTDVDSVIVILSQRFPVGPAESPFLTNDNLRAVELRNATERPVRIRFRPR